MSFNFYNELFVLVVTFILLCPHNFVLHYAGICAKCLVLYCCNFYRAHDASIIYCSGSGFLFLCLSELLSGNLCI